MAPHIAPIAARNADSFMHQEVLTPLTADEPRMLNGSISIQQARPHDANVRSDRLSTQGIHPAITQYNCIVIKEYKNISLRIRR